MSQQDYDSPPDLEEAGRFLELFSNGEDHCFQYYDDTKKTEAAGHFYAQLEDAFPALCAHNRLRRGIYFMVNRGDGNGRSSDNVTAIRAVFVDLDGSPLQPVLEAPIEPNAIIESSPGRYQAFWLVKDCPQERFRGVQHALAMRFNGDASVKDLPRVMRVPGFYHCKGKPVKVKIHSIERVAPYGIEEVVSGLSLKEGESIAKLNQPLPTLESIAPGSISPGERHETLMRFAFRYANENKTREEILMLITGMNAVYCSEPKPMNEIIDIVNSAVMKVPHVDLEGFLKAQEREEPAPPPIPESEFETFDSTTANTGGMKPAFALPESLLITAPGLTGEIANWITDTSFYWQPAYALAASLAFVGMLKGHRVSTSEGGRTNLITIAVGASSSGKTIPDKRVKLLARLAGVSHRMCGEPASAQGLVKGLIEAGHKCFMPWDEIGLSFKEMFARNAPSYKSGITRLILKLYSMADEVVLGFQYANNDGKTPRADLVQPCLCLYGTSTQDGIFSAFSSVEAVNGFAARLLIFETHDYLAPRQPVARIEPDPELVEKVRRMANEENPAMGNLVDIATNPPMPTIIPFSVDAKAAFRDAGRKFEALKNQAIMGRKLAEESIWGRAYEQSTKIALTVEDGNEITGESAEWAIAVVTRLCESMVVATREQIADNQTHAELNLVLNIIKAAYPRWVSSEDIYRRTRSLDRRKRKEHLLNLVEEGTIETKPEETGGRPRQLFRAIVG